MNPRYLSRIISALILGALLGVLLHLDIAKNHKLSKEDYLVKQGERYDQTYSKTQPLVFDVVFSAILAGIGFGIYELLASGIYHLLRLRYHKVNTDPNFPEMLGS